MQRAAGISLVARGDTIDSIGGAPLAKTIIEAVAEKVFEPATSAITPKILLFLLFLYLVLLWPLLGGQERAPQVSYLPAAPPPSCGVNNLVFFPAIVLLSLIAYYRRSRPVSVISLIRCRTAVTGTSSNLMPRQRKNNRAATILQDPPQVWHRSTITPPAACGRR